MKRWTLIGSTILVLGAAAVGWHWWYGGSAVDRASRMLSNGNLSGAKLTLRNAVLHDPANGRAHYLLARVELRTDDPIAAEREVRAAAADGYAAGPVQVMLAAAVLQQKRYNDVLRDVHPQPGMTAAESASVLVDRALAQFSLGQHDAAAQTVAAAQARDPNSFDADMAAARFAQARGDDATGKTQVEAALRVMPNDPDALLMRGELMVNAGQQQQALAAYDAAVSHSSAVGIARLARADLLTSMGRTDDARKDLDSVLAIAPRNPLANMLLARLLMRTGDWAGADGALDKAAPAMDHLPRSDFYLAIVKSHVNQPQQALDAAERYLAHPEGDDLRAAKLVGQLSLATNRPQRALMVLQPLLDAGQADTGTLRMLAVAYQQTGKPELGVQMLQRAAASAPGDAALLTQLAAAKMSLGNATEAAGDLQQALDAQHVSLEAAPVSGGKPSSGQVAEMNTAIALVGAAVRAGDTVRADAALQRLSRMPGVDAERLQLLTGLVDLAKSDLGGARAAFSAAVRIAPQDSGAKVELARVLAMQGDGKQALKMLQALNDKDPANPMAAAALSGMLVDAGKQDEAARSLERAHAANPANQPLAVALLQLYEHQGHTQQALALLDTMQVDQTSPQILALRSQLQAENGDLKGAASQIHAALAKLPNNPALTVQLARDLLATGDVDGAAAAAGDALKANPGNPALMELAVAIAGRHGVPAGLAMAERIDANPANQPASRSLKGDFLLKNNRDQDAVAAYQEADRAAPSSLLTIRAAAVQARMGQGAVAASALRFWLSSHPDAVDVAEVLATLDIAAGKLPQARDELNLVLSHHADDAVALNNLAWLEQQSGNLAKARTLAQRAYLVQPAAQSADTLGWIIFQQGDAKDALPLLQQAASSMRDNASVQFHLAAAMNKTGHSADAVAILKPLAAAPDNFSEKDQAVALLKSLSRP